MWDAAERGQCLGEYPCHAEAVRDACWTPCGRRFLSGSFDNKAAITDVETGGLHTRCSPGLFGSLSDGVASRDNAIAHRIVLTRTDVLDRLNRVPEHDSFFPTFFVLHRTKCKPMHFE